jgi:hypothetical protein
VSAALLALLCLLLVEAQSLAKQRRSSAAAEPDAHRMPLGVLLPTIALLIAGLVVAFRVMWRGHADGWEAVLVWASLAVGLCSAALTAVIVLVPPTRIAWPRYRLLRARAWLPPVAGLVVGLAASPIAFGGDDVVGARFAVYGTCLSNGCGLIQRDGPGPAHRETGPKLNDGELVLVVCQTGGPAPRGKRSRVWDRLANGRYVSDAFVNTPNRSGGYSEGLSRC